MVKLGFIAEGGTEKIILESPAFQSFLQELGLEYIENVVDATGNNNLLPKHLSNHIKILKDKGANFFIILTDLDTDQCITLTKQRIEIPKNCLIIVSIKAIEAWFLSDRLTLQRIIKNQTYVCSNPETINNPYEEIQRLAIEYTGKGLGRSKILIAKKFIEQGFSIRNAASNPNCSSSQYFLGKLNELAVNVK